MLETPPSPLQSKEKQRARPLATGGQARNGKGPVTVPPPSLGPTTSIGAVASEGLRRRMAPSFCSPETLAPLSVFDHPRVRDRSLPVVCRRSTHRPGVGRMLWSQDLRDESLFLQATTDLPPFVEFAGRALGWDDDMLKVIDIASSSEGTCDAFIATLAGAGIPMAEGYLLWELIQRTRRGD